MHPTPTEPLVALTDHERQALLTAAAFLSRSGTTIASQLLTPHQPDQSAVLLAELRDQLLSASFLCRGLGEHDG